MIYLAAPYSSRSQETRSQRVHQAGQAAFSLLKGGHDIFCPIVHGHYIEQAAAAHLDAERWYEHSLSMLSRAYELWVLLLTGWESSRGIAMEVAFARKRSKPVLLLTYEQALRGERPAARRPVNGSGGLRPVS